MKTISKVYIFKKSLKYLVGLFCLISLIACYIPPKYGGYWGVLSWGIPFVILLIFFAWIRKRRHLNFKKTSIYIYALLSLFSLPHISASFNLISSSSEHHSNEIKILNYNVQSFNSYPHLRGKNFINSQKLLDIVLQDSLDIVCLQEYFNHDNFGVFNVKEKMTRKGFNMFGSYSIDDYRGQFGITLFSKYPITHQKDFIFNNKSANRILLTDLVLPSKDTIRVLVCHLQSMSIHSKYLFNWKGGWKYDFAYQKRALKRIYKSFRLRNEQVDVLSHCIESSPYPTIVCGDFNDLPYSYTYHKISSLLSNSFEKNGFGLGITSNHKGFEFLRIDHQFFDKNHFDILEFRTCYEHKKSDHFPLYGRYVLKKNK
ncbi:MAG: hypothetical protein GY827_07855 [Cytophagales bacterium]|nr:hypothetical protein [Cytophagales bacterium]